MTGDFLRTAGSSPDSTETQILKRQQRTQLPVPVRTVVVSCVAVLERQGEDALPDQLFDGVLNVVEWPRFSVFGTLDLVIHAVSLWSR